MKWLSEIIDGLSDKMKKIIISAIVALFIGGGGSGSYLVFAKASALNNHLAVHKKEDTKKRINVIEEQMLEYREMFGRDLENATEKQKKRYWKWEIEVEVLWKELEVKG